MLAGYNSNLLFLWVHISAELECDLWQGGSTLKGCGG